MTDRVSIALRHLIYIYTYIKRITYYHYHITIKPSATDIVQCIDIILEVHVHLGTLIIRRKMRRVLFIVFVIFLQVYKVACESGFGKINEVT